MTLTRRQLLGRSAVTGAGAIVASTGLEALSPSVASASTGAGAASATKVSRLFPPLEFQPGDLLALPAGFAYELISESGVTDIHDGTGTLIGKTPERPDGTLAVAARHGLRLIQNHEGSAVSTLPVPQVEGTVYDHGVLGGGCTVIEATREGHRVSEWVALSGTLNNCAGGPTPWDSWLTCEENESLAGTGTYEKDHGYVFEVFADLPAVQTPLPIKAWGRAAHEAVVVQPGRERVYLTEDASSPTGLLYRWTAPDGERLHPHIAATLADDAGTLEALVVLTSDGSVLPDLAYVTAAQIGRPFDTRWVEVPERNATTTSTRKQFAAGEVTHSKKLEGAWGDGHGMYFVSSYAIGANDLPADATKHDGQIWYYHYRRETLTLVAYFPYSALLSSTSLDPETGLGLSRDLAFDGPDGCHVSPYGSLVLTEDGDTANHVLSWSQETGAQAIARNLIVSGVNSRGFNTYGEMTGPTFSPDGRVLFANVWAPGHVFAITGPWAHYLA